MNNDNGSILYQWMHHGILFHAGLLCHCLSLYLQLITFTMSSGLQQPWFLGAPATKLLTIVTVLSYVLIHLKNGNELYSMGKQDDRCIMCTLYLSLNVFNRYQEDFTGRMVSIGDGPCHVCHDRRTRHGHAGAGTLCTSL